MTEEELTIRALPAAYQEKMARCALAGWRFRRMPGRWYAVRPGQLGIESGTLLLLLDDIGYAYPRFRLGSPCRIS